MVSSFRQESSPKYQKFKSDDVIALLNSIDNYTFEFDDNLFGAIEDEIVKGISTNVSTDGKFLITFSYYAAKGYAETFGETVIKAKNSNQVHIVTSGGSNLDKHLAEPQYVEKIEPELSKKMLEVMEQAVIDFNARGVKCSHTQTYIKSDSKKAMVRGYIAIELNQFSQEADGNTGMVGRIKKRLEPLFAELGNTKDAAKLKSLISDLSSYRLPFTSNNLYYIADAITNQLQEDGEFRRTVYINIEFMYCPRFGDVSTIEGPSFDYNPITGTARLTASLFYSENVIPARNLQRVELLHSAIRAATEGSADEVVRVLSNSGINSSISDKEFVSGGINGYDIYTAKVAIPLTQFVKRY